MEIKFGPYNVVNPRTGRMIAFDEEMLEKIKTLKIPITKDSDEIKIDNFAVDLNKVIGVLDNIQVTKEDDAIYLMGNCSININKTELFQNGPTFAMRALTNPSPIDGNMNLLKHDVVKVICWDLIGWEDK